MSSGDTLITLGSKLVVENTLYPTVQGRYTLVDVPGWYGKPPITLDTESMPGQDGAFPPSEATYGGRNFSVIATATAAPGKDIRQEFWPGFSDVQLELQRFTMADPFGTLFSDVWPNGELKFNLGRVPWIGEIEIPLFAADPRKYRQHAPVGAKPAGAETLDGLHYPLYENGYLDYGDFSIAGGFYLHNAGKAQSWPTFTVIGGMDEGFTITSGEKVLRFEGAVPVGQACVLSPYTGGRAILNGVDRTDLLTQSDWAPVNGGATSPFAFASLGDYTATAYCTADMKDAWI